MRVVVWKCSEAVGERFHVVIQDLIHHGLCMYAMSGCLNIKAKVFVGDLCGCGRVEVAGDQSKPRTN